MTLTNIDIDQLNQSFAIKNNNQSLNFKMGKGDIPVVEINNEFSTSLISLQGAHVLSWKPVGEDDVIWLSSDAKFAVGKSVRGGIPICWPWFGAHESNTAFPAHGYARTVNWQVKETEALASGETQITFQLDTQQLEKPLVEMWPQATVAEYCLTIGKALTMELTTWNNSETAMTIGQALHTYFNINDVRETCITGLEDKTYLDKTDGFKRKIQTGAVVISDEVDRVYLDTADDVVIDDSKRKIIISKKGSHSTVVWNPWKTVADKMGDLGEDGYLKMVCVESANAADDTVSIAAGAHYSLRVIYRLG